MCSGTGRCRELQSGITGTDNMCHSTTCLATGFQCLLSLACASSSASSPKQGLRNIRRYQAATAELRWQRNPRFDVRRGPTQRASFGPVSSRSIRLAFSWANQRAMRSSLNLEALRLSVLSKLKVVFNLTTFHSLVCEPWSFHYFDDT